MDSVVRENGAKGPKMDFVIINQSVNKRRSIIWVTGNSQTISCCVFTCVTKAGIFFYAKFRMKKLINEEITF